MECETLLDPNRRARVPSVKGSDSDTYLQVWAALVDKSTGTLRLFNSCYYLSCFHWQLQLSNLNHG